MNDPKVFKLGIGNHRLRFSLLADTVRLINSHIIIIIISGYPRSGTVLGFKGQGRRVSKFILHTRTLHTGLLELRFIGIH